MAVPAADAAERRPRVPPGTHVTIEGLRKAFDGVPVYDGFDLAIPRGALVSVFGPNGCGKSTLINMMAGLLPMDAGQVLYDGRTVPEIRLGYVFQNYRDALFPWMSCLDNILWPLKFQKAMPRREGLRRVEELVARLEARIDLSRYPYQLSGGQQQLVSILRALILDPEVLFLDEPFSALDYEVTLTLRMKLQQLLAEREVTTLLVSHDLEEAVFLADRVLLLTRRPTRIADLVDVLLPRPRDAEMLTDPRFVELKRHCLAVFRAAAREGLE